MDWFLYGNSLRQKELIQIDETDYRRIGCSSYHLTS